MKTYSVKITKEEHDGLSLSPESRIFAPLVHSANNTSLHPRDADDLVYSTPLYMYRHGGDVFSTAPGFCRHDSAQAGHIYLTKDDIFNATGVHNYTDEVCKKIIENDIAILNGECEQRGGYKWELICKEVIVKEEVFLGCEDAFYDTYEEAKKEALDELLEQMYVTSFEHFAKQ